MKIRIDERVDEHREARGDSSDQHAPLPAPQAKSERRKGFCTEQRDPAAENQETDDTKLDANLQVLVVGCLGNRAVPGNSSLHREGIER